MGKNGKKEDFHLLSSQPRFDIPLSLLLSHILISLVSIHRVGTDSLSLLKHERTCPTSLDTNPPPLLSFFLSFFLLLLHLINFSWSSVLCFLLIQCFCRKTLQQCKIPSTCSLSMRRFGSCDNCCIGLITTALIIVAVGLTSFVNRMNKHPADQLMTHLLVLCSVGNSQLSHVKCCNAAWNTGWSGGCTAKTRWPSNTFNRLEYFLLIKTKIKIKKSQETCYATGCDLSLKLSFGKNVMTQSFHDSWVQIHYVALFKNTSIYQLEDAGFFFLCRAIRASVYST